MSFLKNILAFTAALSSLGGAYAKLDLSASSTVAVYWGQNSFNGNGDLAQQNLAHYCNDPNIDVILLAFLMKVNGQGGYPEFDFASAGDKCTKFEGTGLLNCPEIGADIKTCQKNGKSIILSIGGATYSEGGFSSEADAKAGADLMWKTFGSSEASTSHSNVTFPANATHTSRIVRSKNKVLRPFGDVSVDGFDFDFEAATTNMAPFANRLRELSDADHSKQYFLTAAPQCPYPDVADKDILNGPVSVDAIFVQFYNNPCGVQSFVSGQDKQTSFNFETWDKWAKNDSQNKKVKVFLGAPANTGAAGTGYVQIKELQAAIEYSKTFSSFGGVMLWDVTQAYGNPGYLDGIKSALGKAKSRITTRPYRYRG